MSPAAMDPDATRKLPPVTDDVADPFDGEVRAGGDEILTGEIVLRDTAAQRPTELEPASPGTEGWLVDEALFTVRPPIASHRRSPGITVPLILAAVVIVAGVAAWVAVGHMGRGVPPVTLGSPRTVDAGVPGTTGTPGPGPSSAVSVPTVPPVAGGRGPRSSTSAAPVPPSTGTPSAASASPSASRSPAGSLGTDAPAPVTTPVTTPADGMVVRVVSLTSGQSMSVASGSTDDGAAIVQSTATTKVEEWKLVAAWPTCFSLINQYTGKALDNPGGGPGNGTPMRQWSYGIGNLNQIWCLRPVGDSRFSIQSMRTGSLLDLRDGGAGGGVIQQWFGNPRSPDSNQTWVLLAVA